MFFLWLNSVLMFKREKIVDSEFWVFNSILCAYFRLVSNDRSVFVEIWIGRSRKFVFSLCELLAWLEYVLSGLGFLLLGKSVFFVSFYPGRFLFIIYLWWLRIHVVQAWHQVCEDVSAVGLFKCIVVFLFSPEKKGLWVSRV